MLRPATLPAAVYTAAQTRTLDRVAMEDFGLGDGVLMARAGTAAFQLLRLLWPRARRICVLCGPGNNGGDGFVVAWLAREAGLQVTVISAAQADRFHGDARSALAEMHAQGVALQPWQDKLPEVDVIVDALFGTGLERDLASPWSDMVAAMNTHPAHVLALDMPSGVNSDTGAVMGVAVHADATLSFIGLNLGLFTGAGPDYCGQRYFQDLRVLPGVYDAVNPEAWRLDANWLNAAVPYHGPGIHKSSRGRLLVVGGMPQYAGAPVMAGQAAYRVGAGLVTVATHSDTSVSSAPPELIIHQISPGQVDKSLAPLLEQAQVLALGPGLGQTSWSSEVFAQLEGVKVPTVIDADALRWLARNPFKRDHWILTPHPGEAAALLDTDITTVQGDRPAAARAIQEQYGGLCVLKGAGTLITDGDCLWISDVAEPLLATAGTGDILTGLIAGLLAQGCTLAEAAGLGVWIEGRSAALWRERQVIQKVPGGMMATDLLANIPVALEALAP